MVGKLRVAIGVLLIGAAGVVGFVGWSRGAVSGVAGDPAALGRAAQAAADGLDAEQESLRQRARIAAGLEPLRAALSNRVDVATLIDLFANEDWWRAFRDEVAASGVVVGEAGAHHGNLEIGSADHDVVAAARRQGLASEIVAIGGRPVILAAARVDINVKGDPIVVLAKPFEPRALEAVASRTQLSLLLTDGRVPLAIASAEAQRRFLESLVVRTSDTSVVDSSGGQEAARVSLSKNMNLWVARPLANGAPDGQRVVFFGGAGALVVAGLVLLLVGGRRPVQPGFVNPEDARAEHTLPFGTPPIPRTGVQVMGGSLARQRGTGSQTGPLMPAAAPANGDVPNTLPEGAPAAIIAQPPISDPPQKLFGRYKVVERLGVGGMSEVYTAVAYGAEGFSRTFVIKRLRPELARHKEAVSQFIDEARVQASLVHSNIVPVFDFGMMGGEYFMIEEYILGRDLARVSTRCVERTGFRLEPRLVYYFAYEALQALSYAHTKRGRDGQPLGIVHRDVSATNIMVSAVGEVKLFDFGIAKANRRETKTQAGMVKGNANFMSPEQARGQNVDQRSDLFSLALVMYFCFTNQLLYSGDNDLDILYRAACGLTPEDIEAVRRLPPPAAEILEKALNVDPSVRYQSAEEFAIAMAPHAAGMKPEAASLMELLFGEELRTEAA